MMVSGLPPEFQIDCSTAFRLASVKARCVPPVRVPVPSAADGSAPPAPFDVLVLIQERIEAVLRATASAAGDLDDVDADQERLHVALELEALEHLLVGEFVVAAGMLDRLLGAGDA